MDIGDIDKIINRKRILEFTDQFKEIVAKENKEIIKLRVAQDAESWAEKEKLSQLKVENERLQYKIQELQRQKEEVSMMYQAELRRRPEDLNKLAYTRKLSDELQKLAQQCKEASDRGEADRARLQAQHDAAARSVERLKREHAANLEHAQSCINALLEKLKEMTEHQDQLRETYNDSQLKLNVLSSQLEAATSDRNELAAATDDAKKKLEKANSELDKRDATITNLQHEMRKMAIDIHSQLVEAKKKDNDLKSATEEIESLKKALSNQEQFTKMQCDRGDELLEKLALAENQQQLAAASNEDYKKKLEEMTSTCENFKNNIQMLKDEKDALTKELESKEEMINLYNTELDSHQQLLLEFESKLDKTTSKLDKTTSKLNKTIEECENKDKINEKLKADNETHIKTLSECKIAFQNYREEAEEKLKTMAETIKEKCFEIEIHTSTIREANAELQAEKEERAKLMEELRNVTASLEERDHELEVKTSALIEEKEARAKIETDFVNLKRDSEIQMENLREQMKKVSQLEAGMRAKEEKHSREMADFLKVRAEMDREKSALREVINGLEKRIVNIVKMASKTNVEGPRFRPEPDEDAVDEWGLSARFEADRGQAVEAEQDAVMIPARFDSFNDSIFNNFSEPSCGSLRLRPQRPTAVAAEMRPRSQKPPTPAAAPGARDAHHTALQPHSQADQWFEQLRGELPTTTHAPKRARPNAPATAVMGDAATHNDPPAAHAIPTVSRTTTKERRFFKTPRNTSTAKDNEKKTKKKK